MKLRNILIISLLGFCAAAVTAEAQVVLGDKQAQTVDLGFGVESTEFLTTAATYTITAEELSRTSAISLADALYGKLLGLNAFQNTGFKGEEGRASTSAAPRLPARPTSSSSWTAMSGRSTVSPSRKWRA